MKKVKKGEITTFLTLGLILVGTVFSLLSGLMINRQKNIASNPKAQSPKTTTTCTNNQKCGSGKYWTCTFQNGCDVQSCSEQDLEFRCCVADRYNEKDKTYRIRDYGCKGQPCQNFKIRNQIGHLVGCAGYSERYFKNGEVYAKLKDYTDPQAGPGKYVDWSSLPTPTSSLPTPTKINQICSCAHSCISGATGGCWWGKGPYECNPECCSKGVCPTSKLDPTLSANLTRIPSDLIINHCGNYCSYKRKFSNNPEKKFYLKEINLDEINPSLYDIYMNNKHYIYYDGSNRINNMRDYCDCTDDILIQDNQIWLCREANDDNPDDNVAYQLCCLDETKTICHLYQNGVRVKDKMVE